MQNEHDPSPQQQKPGDSSFLTVAGFELSLILVALLIGWCFDFDPRHDMHFGSTSHDMGMLGRFLAGIVATLPLLFGLVVFERLDVQATRQIREFMAKNVKPWLQPMEIWQLVLLGVIAGVTEELLFRGAIQFAATTYISTVGAIFFAATIFGITHWVTPTYAAMAFLAALYLGWLFVFTDSLIPPVVAHAVYDIVALIYMTRFAWTNRSHES